jgi:hypothetical protein
MNDGSERMPDEEVPARIRNLGNHYCSNLCCSVAGLDRLVEGPLPFCLMIEAMGRRSDFKFHSSYSRE